MELAVHKQVRGLVKLIGLGLGDIEVGIDGVDRFREVDAGEVAHFANARERDVDDVNGPAVDVVEADITIVDQLIAFLAQLLGRDVVGG